MWNKRGVGAEEWLEQIPKIILTIIVMAGIFVLVSIFVNIRVDVKPVQREVLFNRLLYQPNSIMYTDQFTGQVYPGIIDLSKFTNETLDNSAKYLYERQISAKLELFDWEKKLVQTAYLNGVWYGRIEPLAGAAIEGASSGKIMSRTVPVSYRDGNTLRRGYLKVQILTAN
jgi:hypothetical protein